jgi:putative spermidine/putrescine transport system permease protein
MAWAYLRVPRMRRVIEFLCLLPLAIPAVVLVVGIAPINRFLLLNVASSTLILFFFDIILVLPYAYRAIDGGLKSADVNTLADAARSLGASWPRVMIEIIVPNIRTGILSAAVLAVALVLGEYTIASLLSYTQVLQVVIYLLGKRDASISVAVSFASLLFVFILLLLITHFAPGGRSSAQEPEDEEVAA